MLRPAQILGNPSTILCRFPTMIPDPHPLQQLCFPPARLARWQTPGASHLRTKRGRRLVLLKGQHLAKQVCRAQHAAPLQNHCGGADCHPSTRPPRRVAPFLRQGKQDKQAPALHMNPGGWVAGCQACLPGAACCAPTETIQVRRRRRIVTLRLWPAPAPGAGDKTARASAQDDHPCRMVKTRDGGGAGGRGRGLR